MCELLKKLSWKKILLGAFIFSVISMVCYELEPLFTSYWYMLPEYYPVWSKIMMPTAGPPPASFLVIDYIVTLITGIFITSYYSLTSPLYGNKFWSKVCGFTVMTSVLEFSLFTLVVFLLLNVPIVLLCSWFISNVIIFFLSGMVFAKLKI